MAPEDLHEYAGLTTTTIMCKQRITLSAAGIDLIKWALEGTFGAIEEISPRKSSTNGATQVNGNGASHEEEVADEEIDYSPHAVSYLVMGCVIVRYQKIGQVEVEWEGNMLNDGIADAVLAVLFTVESSPAAVKRKTWLTSVCIRLLKFSQNLRKIINTATIKANATFTPTSHQKSVSHVYACSLKPNLAP